MDTLMQVISALYVALGEAAGGPRALRVANRVLRDAIVDGAVDDPAAIEILESLAHDEDDEIELSNAPSIDAITFQTAHGDLFEQLASATATLMQ